MNRVYDNLPKTMNQALLKLFDEAETLGIDPDILAPLLMAPLVSEHFAEAQAISGQRLDTLREATRTNAGKIMRLLCNFSFSLFVDYLTRHRKATEPWQRTRWRLVLCGDDSLLVHAEENQAPDVVNIWSTLYKTFRKAHDLVVLGVTVGPKTGTVFFPLWVELWRQPGLRKQTRPQRMAAALKRLNQRVRQAGLSLDGIDFAADNGYHSPTVAKAVKACGLLFTTQLKSNQALLTLEGADLVTSQLRDEMSEAHPIGLDPRAGPQAYYWRKGVVHPYLGVGTLVIQRRKLRSGGFQYHYHFTQRQDAKAITVIQIAKRRWPLEVFFRDGKQHLGLGHLPYRRWSSLRGHVAIRGLLYLLLAQVRRLWRWPRSQRTIGALKRRFGPRFVEIFRSLLPLNGAQAA